MHKTYIDMQANPVNAYLPEYRIAQVKFTRKVKELLAVSTNTRSSRCEDHKRIQGKCGIPTPRTDAA